MTDLEQKLTDENTRLRQALGILLNPSPRYLGFSPVEYWSACAQEEGRSDEKEDKALIETCLSALGEVTTCDTSA